MEHCEPELFPQLDEPLTPEREDGRHRIDHQMIVEQREAGEAATSLAIVSFPEAAGPYRKRSFIRKESGDIKV